jgi:hypothetical protein
VASHFLFGESIFSYSVHFPGNFVGDDEKRTDAVEVAFP